MWSPDRDGFPLLFEAFRTVEGRKLRKMYWEESPELGWLSDLHCVGHFVRVSPIVRRFSDRLSQVDTGGTGQRFQLIYPTPTLGSSTKADGALLDGGRLEARRG